MSLKVGDKVPLFTLKDQNGGDFDIAQLLGKQTLVLYFYPKNYTPGCTREACGFRDSYEEFTALGAQVIGISADSDKSHQKFAKSYGLPFILLADSRKKVRKLFGVPSLLMGLLPGRETYVIDKEGTVAMVFNSVNADRHIDKALKAVKRLK